MVCSFRDVQDQKGKRRRGARSCSGSAEGLPNNRDSMDSISKQLHVVYGILWDSMAFSGDSMNFCRGLMLLRWMRLNLDIHALPSIVRSSWLSLVRAPKGDHVHSLQAIFNGKICCRS